MISRTGEDGSILYEVIERRSPHRMLVRIADDDLPFGGTWTYELAEIEGYTIVTITENGFVTNPFFRFFSRFVFTPASKLT